MSLLTTHHNHAFTAPRRCKSFTFDVNQQADSLVQWEQRYDQHSAGTFSGYLDELRLGGVHLFQEFTNRALQQQCCIGDDKLWLGFSLQAQQAKINNHAVSDGQLMVRPAGVEFELLTPADFSIFGLVLDKDSLNDELFSRDIELWHNHNLNGQFTEANPYVNYELAKLISLLLDSTATLQNASQPFDMARLKRLTPLINSRIADLLAQLKYSEDETTITRQTKLRVIASLRQHIQQTGNYPLTISELCRITNVSRRTLQYCFEQALALSPMQYIRDCRLNEIRRILLSAQTEVVIADVAINYGFFHLGTFNSQYKQLFAETPSQTIKRASRYQHHGMIEI